MGGWQIALIIISAVGLGISLQKGGRDFWINLIAVAILQGILIFGGWYKICS